MLVPLKELVDLYRRMQQDASSLKSSILILAAADVDSLAALQILTALFRADCMQYAVIPMLSLSQMLETLQALEKSATTPTSIVCLNCGATCDLSATWPILNELNCYILDCHRPVHHSNAHSQRVKLVDDQTDRNLDNLPRPGEFEEANQEDQPVSSESESEATAEPRKRAHAEIEERMQKRVKIETYYSGSYFGTSVAWLMFELAKQMNRENNEMLWMALVGITEQLVHLKVDKFQFEQRCKEAQADILRLNPQLDAEEAAFPELGRVSIELKELRVMLLRHWTLYDSLYYSNIVAARLGTWKQQGRDKFHGVLVKLGVSLKDAQQLYTFLPHKTELKARAMECLPQFELDELLCTSYLKQYDLRTQFSSADVVYAVAALLESPESEASAGFWQAHDALSSLELLQRGAQLAIDLHKAVFALGTSLIEKKAVNPTNDFRYAIINNDSWEQARFFHFPYALKRLCVFLMEAYKHQRTSIRAKPMVLAMVNSKRNVYLVIGVMDYESAGRNTFRARFDEAVEASQAQNRTDFFEGELIEVSKDNFPAFMDALTNDRDHY